MQLVVGCIYCTEVHTTNIIPFEYLYRERILTIISISFRNVLILIWNDGGGEGGDW